MSFLLLEDGSALLLESGFHLLLEGGCTPYPPIAPALLLQSGFFIRLEDCGHLLLEGGVIPVRKKGRQNPQYRRISNEAMEEEDLELILTLWLAVKDSPGR